MVVGQVRGVQPTCMHMAAALATEVLVSPWCALTARAGTVVGRVGGGAQFVLALAWPLPWLLLSGSPNGNHVVGEWRGAPGRGWERRGVGRSASLLLVHATSCNPSRPIPAGMSAPSCAG